MPPNHRALIDCICAASSPVWIDLVQRRRWLEAQAESYKSETAKQLAVASAASGVGFRFEGLPPELVQSELMASTLDPTS